MQFRQNCKVSEIVSTPAIAVIGRLGALDSGSGQVTSQMLGMAVDF